MQQLIDTKLLPARLTLGCIQQTGGPLDGIPDLINGIAPAFKPHGLAAMGKLLIPGNEVKATFVAIYMHGRFGVASLNFNHNQGCIISLWQGLNKLLKITHQGRDDVLG